MKRSAVFSYNRHYRYALTRSWHPAGSIPRSFVVIGINPSSADESRDDATIRRCIQFAAREECNQLIMLNLFAYRSTEWTALKVVRDPIGKRNDATLKMFLRSQTVAHVVAAWGAKPIVVERTRWLKEQFGDLEFKCFGLTNSGHPKHPLYLKADTPLTSYAL